MGQKKLSPAFTKTQILSTMDPGLENADTIFDVDDIRVTEFQAANSVMNQSQARASGGLCQFCHPHVCGCIHVPKSSQQQSWATKISDDLSQDMRQRILNSCGVNPSCTGVVTCCVDDVATGVGALIAFRLVTGGLPDFKRLNFCTQKSYYHLCTILSQNAPR